MSTAKSIIYFFFEHNLPKPNQAIYVKSDISMVPGVRKKLVLMNHLFSLFLFHLILHDAGHLLSVILFPFHS